MRYRWPVRFAMSVGQKPLCGQIVDVTSRALAFLYHPGENCPAPDRLITASFGVPHFNSQGSFDTVFFKRVGRVCRVDSLSSKVNRVAIQFAEPLFFRPGEQNISDSDAQETRRKAQALAERIAKLKAEAAREIARVSAEAADAIAGIEVGFDAEPSASADGNGMNAKQNPVPPKDRGLLKKLDSFITDKSKVF